MSMIGNYISVAPDDVKKVQSDAGFAEQLMDESDAQLCLSIEKSWQAVHFVLNGDPWKCTGALGNAVLGGSEVGGDLGYGPARFLAPDEVKETARALNELSVEQFVWRLSGVNFKASDIYVFAQEDPKDPDVIEELSGYYGDIRKFFQDAAAKNHGILLFLG